MFSNKSIYKEKKISNLKADNKKIKDENKALRHENENLKAVIDAMQQSIDIINDELEEYERQHCMRIDDLDRLRLKYSMLINEASDMKKEFRKKLDSLLAYVE